MYLAVSGHGMGRVLVGLSLFGLGLGQSHENWPSYLWLMVFADMQYV